MATKKKRKSRKLPKRHTYYVSPDLRLEDGRKGWNKLRWAVKKQYAKMPSRRTKTQAEAIKIAKRLAKRDGNGKVLVKGRNGQFRYEATYGRDPRRSKG